MQYPIYQINAFSNDPFGGNSACVVPLKSWLTDELMLSIAKQNGVAETAFFIDQGSNVSLRWFTPDNEIDLCGHATLATAHCLVKHLNYRPTNSFHNSEWVAICLCSTRSLSARFTSSTRNSQQLT